MSVYRYTRRGVAQTGAAAEASSSVEVTLTNPEFKAELDRTMDRMGFEFTGSREEYQGAPAPAFPVAWGSSPGGHADEHGDGFLDRPTPVAGAPRAIPIPVAELLGGGIPPAGEYDAAALGFSPSWEGAPQPTEMKLLPEQHTTFRFAVGFPNVVEVARRWAWSAALLASLILVHLGVLGSAPSADDLVRLYDGAAHGFVTAIVKQEGVHALPLSRLVVWLLHQALGLRTGWLFLIVFALHATCAVLARRVLFSMTKRPVLATAIAALWAISPLHRGTLAALFSLGAVVATALALVVVHGIVRAEEDDVPITPRRLLGWSGLLFVAALAAPTGTAFALGMPIFALLYVPRGATRRRVALGLLPAASLALAVYTVARLFGPPEPLGRFIRGFPLFLELLAYGVGNFFVGPFVAVGPGGEPVALIGSPGPSAGVVFAGAAAFLVMTATAWALSRNRGDVRRRAAAFAALAGIGYLFAAFDGAKFVVRDGIPAVAVRPEPHYAAMLCIALSIGLVAGSARVPSFRMPFVLPIAVGVLSLLATLLAWPVASKIDERTAQIRKGLDDAERALERAVGATEEGKDAYLENVDLPFVPRAVVGRDRLRFPGLFSYFALAHPGGELGGRTVHFVEGDAKLVAQIRETVRPKVAALVESAEEARQKGHALTTPRLSRSTSTAAPQGSAAPRRPPRTAAPRDRKKLPFKPDEAK